MIQDKILKSFDKKNVLVTGGTGLIGRQVTDLLCSAGASVKIVSLDKINVNDKAEHVLGDLTSFDFCKNITENMDFVFHLAGIKGSASVTEKKLASHFVPILMMNTNILEACRINRVKKVVYTSSIGAYSDAEIFTESDYKLDSLPMDFAGWAKRMAELQIYAYRVQYNLDNFSIVRPCNVYGPGDNFDPNNAMVIPSLMHRI
ncbi:NAD(P)-dependent oxidoreductase, partial [bacterium]|nr:NAD(P)-dependent oxidoreductase [bacterium]